MNYLYIDRAMDFIGDQGHMVEMLKLFEQALATEVPQVQTLLNQGDVTAAQKMLHGLKGFVPVFCTDDLIDQVATVEALAKNSDAATVNSAFELVYPLLDSLRTEVQAYLANHAG